MDTGETCDPILYEVMVPMFIISPKALETVWS